MDPRSHTLARLEAGFSVPFHLAPVGGFSGGSCGAERREDGAHPPLFPAWLMLGKQEEVGGPRAAGEVLCERHCRS